MRGVTLSSKQAARKRIWVISPLIILVLALAGYGVWHFAFAQPAPPSESKVFSGDQALQDVQYQVSLGPRTVGSPAHDQAVTWMESQIKQAGWQVEHQKTTAMGHPVDNLIAKQGNGTPWIILGAHYDSRLLADQDPDVSKRTQPVPGANDGASGVAVLLELARTLPKDLNKQVWLLMIDNEDNGDIPGWDWLLGSQAFVDQLQGKPDAVVIIDMIGDANLNIYQERNSNVALTQQVWSAAARLGYEKEFISSYKYTMIDDHMPFINAGIPAIDIIDFDYPYWHTTEDTTDKVSAASLKAVGDTLEAWLEAPWQAP